MGLNFGTWNYCRVNRRPAWLGYVSTSGGSQTGEAASVLCASGFDNGDCACCVSGIENDDWCNFVAVWFASGGFVSYTGCERGVAHGLLGVA